MGEAGHRSAGGEGGAGPISKLRNNNRRSLGLKWSMSEVGTPPPHSLDKPHGLVASNTHIVSAKCMLENDMLKCHLELLHIYFFATTTRT